MGGGRLCVPGSFGRVRKRGERGDEEGKGAMPGWKEEPDFSHFVFSTSTHARRILFPEWIAHLLLIRCCNEMELSLANTRLRFKCLE